jgi:hypothetical protein
VNQSEARADAVRGVEEQEERFVPRRLQVAPAFDAGIDELPAPATGSGTVRQWWAALKASIAAAFRAESRLYADLEVDQAKLAARAAEQVALARVMGPPFGSTPGL